MFEAATDNGGVPEVKRRSGCVGRLSGWNQGIVYGRILAGIDLQQVIVDCRRTLAIEVEIGVIGEVDNGGFVGCGVVGDF